MNGIGIGSNSTDRTGMIRYLEETSLSAWPALETLFLEGWIVRFAQGYTKRANSVVPLYGINPDSSEVGAESRAERMPEKLNRCEELYRAHGLPTVFKLPPVPGASELDAALAARSYRRLDETLLMTAAVRGIGKLDRPVEILDHPTDRWLESLYACSAIDDAVRRRTAATLLSRIPTMTLFALASGDGQTNACGLGVVNGRDVGLFDIAVRGDRRGLGFGTAIVDALLSAASRCGASRAYLQVTARNAPAIGLYRNFGFTESYRYHYRVSER